MTQCAVCVQLASDLSVEEAVGQMQRLQAYLCSYATWGVPVVECKLSQQARAVDQLHDYLLLCIEAATQSSQVAA